ncbi:MAG TPA: LON peptidase substrate-binding domain-containing protein [Acidimicrobiales bacterium]|nr:LON peptidase substrate-binding domain-containing protein [Acidimicrobiales bacterium]
MAMFPLGSVLFPGADLALRVFEPRYRALVDACLEGAQEFGVTLIERGSEVGGGDSRFDVGCVARLVAAARFDDGRWAIAAAGTRRVRVRRWLPEDPYPRAEVEDWIDVPAGDGPPPSEVATRLRRVLALAAELGDTAAAVMPEPAGDLVTASYELSRLAPVGPLDQQALLAAETPGRRLVLLARLLAEEEDVLARRLAGG